MRLLFLANIFVCPKISNGDHTKCEVSLFHNPYL